MYTASVIRDNYLYLQLRLRDDVGIKIFIDGSLVKDGYYAKDSENGFPLHCESGKNDLWESGEYRFSLDDGIHRISFVPVVKGGTILMELPLQQVFIKNSFECIIVDLSDKNNSDKKARKVSPDEFFGRVTGAVFADNKKLVQNSDEIEKKNAEYKEKLDITESERSELIKSESIIKKENGADKSTNRISEATANSFRIRLSRKNGDNSYFDGNLFVLFLRKLLFYFLNIITLGLAYPLAKCMLCRYKYSHTVINDRRMFFNGKTGELYKFHIKSWILCVVTLGVYLFWLKNKYLIWEIDHVGFEGDTVRNLGYYLRHGKLCRLKPDIKNETVYIKSADEIREEEIEKDSAEFDKNEIKRNEKLNKLGINKDMPFEALYDLVRHNNPEAQYALANCLKDKHSEDKADDISKLLEISSDNGYIPSMFEYAAIIKDKEAQKATEYIIKAADGGYLPAQIEYMRMCFNHTDGEALGIDADFSASKGVYWYGVIKKRGGELSKDDDDKYKIILDEAKEDDKIRLQKEKEEKAQEKLIEPKMRPGLSQVILSVCLIIAAGLMVWILLITGKNMLGISSDDSIASTLRFMAVVPYAVILVSLASARKTRIGKVFVFIGTAFLVFYLVVSMFFPKLFSTTTADNTETSTKTELLESFFTKERLIECIDKYDNVLSLQNGGGNMTANDIGYTELGGDPASYRAVELFTDSRNAEMEEFAPYLSKALIEYTFRNVVEFNGKLYYIYKTEDEEIYNGESVEKGKVGSNLLNCSFSSNLYKYDAVFKYEDGVVKLTDVIQVGIIG